jgi:predicted ATPase with chaperone activity
VTAIAETIQPAHSPSSPASLEESGLTLDLLIQLILKTLHFSGELTGTDLATRLGLSFPVIERALEFLISQHQIAIAGGTMVGRASYRYRITDTGRTRASLFLSQNAYVGRAPVPLDQYRRYLTRVAPAFMVKATRDRIRQAFSHLVIGDRVLDQLGPAINAGHSMFVYGPPGNGKTVISQALRNLFEGDCFVPHALEVEGNIIRFFDPIAHEELPMPAEDWGLEAHTQYDRRWVRCRRPMVTVGGELRLEALELSYDRVSGIYRAPVQTLANGGVLVIDDFGRQQCSPRELLNRWIVPLESRVDILTLQSGQKVELPFMVLVAFATNLRPADLVDEAFLRRIQFKIFAQNPTVEEFATIFENCCRERNLRFNRQLVDRLVTRFSTRGIALRGCQPRDLIEHALALAEYLGEPRELTLELLEAACDSYFVDETDRV